MDQELNSAVGETNKKGTKNGTCSDDSRISLHLQTVIAVEANETTDSNEKSNGSSLNKAIPEDNCSSFVIDVNCEDGGNCTVQSVGAENQRVCRICHLSTMENGTCSDDSRISLHLQTVIAVEANETTDSNEKSNGSSLNKAIPEDSCSSFVIDVNCTDGGSCTVQSVGAENQRVCRICHLSTMENGRLSMELMELGCGCKGELEAAHTHCAEAWFKVKGNRLCEICGEIAKNITGVSDIEFLEEWKESRFDADRGRSNGSSDGNGNTSNCTQRRPFCTFLIACLVISFVLPWLFRINML